MKHTRLLTALVLLAGCSRFELRRAIRMCGSSTPSRFGSARRGRRRWRWIGCGIPCSAGFSYSPTIGIATAKLSADELRAMERDQRAQLKAVHYFLELRVNGQPVPVGEVRDFQVRPGGEQFGFRFFVPVPPSVAEGTIEIVIQDPTILIAFAPRAQSPVRAEAPSQYAVECGSPRTRPRAASAWGGPTPLRVPTPLTRC